MRRTRGKRRKKMRRRNRNKKKMKREIKKRRMEMMNMRRDMRRTRMERPTAATPRMPLQLCIKGRAKLKGKLHVSFCEGTLLPSR